MILIPRLARLIKLIISEGKLRSSGPDFARARALALRDLVQFCPPVATTRSVKKGWKEWLENSPWRRTWYGQAVYLRSVMRKGGGHLWVSTLNVCYIRNPKAASTSVAHALLAAQYPGLTMLSLTSEKINFLADAHLRAQLSPSERGAIFFTVVRNPFARIVSVYREFFEKKETTFIYDDYLFGILPRHLSFREFVRRLRLIPDILKDQHLKPQSCILKFYHQQRIDVRIFKLEEPRAIQSFLGDHGLMWRKINSSEIPYDYRSYYDEETIDAVYGIYKDDFILFNYGAEYEALKAPA